jgi:hypothetical protein
MGNNMARKKKKRNRSKRQSVVTVDSLGVAAIVDEHNKKIAIGSLKKGDHFLIMSPSKQRLRIVKSHAGDITIARNISTGAQENHPKDTMVKFQETA